MEHSLYGRGLGDLDAYMNNQSESPRSSENYQEGAKWQRNDFFIDYETLEIHDLDKSEE